MDVDSQLYKIVEMRKEDLDQCQEELKALKENKRKKKSKLKRPSKPNVSEAKPKHTKQKPPSKPNVDDPKHTKQKPPSNPNVDDASKLRSSSKVTYDNVGYDDDVDPSEEYEEQGTFENVAVDLLDDSSDEEDQKSNSAKRQRHKTSILDPSQISPTKVLRPLRLDDAQSQLDSLSRSAGLQECHLLEFINQEGRPRPPKEKFARHPALLVHVQKIDELLDDDELVMEWCDYKIFNHFHRFLHERMSEHSFPVLWEQLIQGCVLNPNFDMSGFESAIQNAFGVWGTLEQGFDTFLAVQDFAMILKNVTTQKCKCYSSEAGKHAVSSLKVTWIQIIATFFRSHMVDFQYLNEDEIFNVSSSYVTHNYKIPKSKDSCTLTQYILWSQYQKVKHWHRSPVMRKLYHDIENFPNNSFGKETNTENSTSQLITFALEHIFNVAFEQWPKVKSEFRQEHMEEIDIHDYDDSPHVPKDYFEMKNKAPKRSTKRRSTSVLNPPLKKAKTKYDNVEYANVDHKKYNKVREKGGDKKDNKVGNKGSKGSSVIGVETNTAVKETKSSNVIGSKKLEKDNKVGNKGSKGSSVVTSSAIKQKKSSKKKSSNVTRRTNISKSIRKKGELKPPSEIYSNFFQNFNSRGIENASYSRNITFLPDNENSPSEELMERFQKALKAPELGCVFVDFAGDVHLLKTDNLVKKHAREYLDAVGKQSRKEQSDNEHPMKDFQGHDVPNNKCAAYLVSSPKRLNECYTKAYHIYAAQVDDPDTKRVTQGIVLNIEDPILQCHTCAKHPKGCGRTLKVGDVVKIDGSTPATLITGRAWMFNVTRFNGDDIDRKCGVGVLKCFATQPHIVANRVAIVTEIGEHEPTDKPHISTVAQKCKYAMIAFLDGNAIVSSSARAQDLTDTHSDSSDDDSDSD
jgi:hypothetical protein